MRSLRITQSLIGMTFIVTAWLLASAVPAWPAIGSHGGSPFAGCGTLVQGVECVLFRADAGGLYVVSFGNHAVGDRIFVQGTIDKFCFSFCQQGNGCINNATISTCPSGAAVAAPATPTRSGPFHVDDLINMLNQWG